MTLFPLLYKALRRAKGSITRRIDQLRTHIILCGNGVRYTTFRTTGVPYVVVARGGACTIGPGFAMNNGAKGSPIGCFEPCTLFVDRGARLAIGSNVGISQTALVAMADITIERNVKMGGGVRASIPLIFTRLMPPCAPQPTTVSTA